MQSFSPEIHFILSKPILARQLLQIRDNVQYPPYIVCKRTSKATMHA